MPIKAEPDKGGEMRKHGALEVVLDRSETQRSSMSKVIAQADDTCTRADATYVHAE